MQDIPVAASKSSPPLRRFFFLTLIFLGLPFLYNYGAKLHSSVFVDLPSFYYAAQTAFRHHQSPYAPGALDWGAAARHQRIYPYLYPPPTLLLFAPFAALPYKAAALLMLAANQACVFGLLFLLLRLVGVNGFLRPGAENAGEGARQALIALFLTVYLFLFQPIVLTLELGQINLFVIVLLCLTWLALQKNVSPALCALPLALAIVLKTYPVLFLPVLLIQGRRRTAGWTVGFLALLTAAAFLVLPRVLWQDWRVDVLPYGGYMKTAPGLFSPSAVENQSVNGFAARLLLDPQTAARVVPAAAEALAYFVCAALFGVQLWLSRRLRQARKSALSLEFALFLLTMYLVAPLSWEHHLVFVLPPIFLALTRIFSQQESRGTILWVAASAFVIAWAIPTENAGWERHLFHLLLSLKFYAALALWAFFAVWITRVLRDEKETLSEAEMSRHAAFN